ncbi:hypothetical protein C6501_13485 [Candidatus Poribacteria bacterium]|nr:MAG: hypothetical protein C6501_13485 [Candidatus Poribacteria bacterium]
MKQYSPFITLSGGILAFFSFALPWEDNLSGAQLANGFGDTLVTMLLIVALAFISISVCMLNRFTSWNPISKIVALTLSSIGLFLYLLFFEATISGRFVSSISRISAVVIVFIFALAVFGISVYVANRHVFLTSWRPVLALIVGSIGILSCFIPILTSFYGGVNFILIAFFAALTITGISIFRLIRQPPWKSWSTFLVLISSSVGLCCFLILFFGISLNIAIGERRFYDPGYGAFLTAVGYIFAMIGILSSLETANNSASQNTREEEVNSRGGKK